MGLSLLSQSPLSKRHSGQRWYLKKYPKELSPESTTTSQLFSTLTQFGPQVNWYPQKINFTVEITDH